MALQPDPRWSSDAAAVYAEVDLLIAETMYHDPPPAVFERITGQFSQLPEDMWEALLERWDRVRAYHYALLLEYPALEPEQIRRQTWLTNLFASRGAVIEETIILRQELGLVAPAQQTEDALLALAESAQHNDPPQDWQPRDAMSRQVPPMLPTVGPSDTEVARKRGLSPEERPTIAEGLTRKDEVPHGRP